VSIDLVKALNAAGFLTGIAPKTRCLDRRIAALSRSC
jgi:hypothetical protein